MLVSVAACGEDDVQPPVDTSGNNNNNGDNNDKNDAQTKPSNGFDAWDTEGYHIFVSPKGLDSNDGLTEANSVKTIERAQEIAAEFVDNEDKLPVIISLDEGYYTSAAAIKVISGSADTPVIFTSRNGKAVISGGTKIALKDIKKCADSWILGHIQSDEVKANLYEVDLSLYDSVLTSILNKVDDMEVRYDVLEFFCGDETLDLARWPNKDEWAPAAEADNFSTKGFEITRYINYDDGNGGFLTPTQAAASSIAATGKMNVFIMDATHEVIKDWDFENEEIHTIDFFGNDWDDMIHKIVKYTDVSDNPAYYNNTYFKSYITTDRGRNYNGEMAAPDEFGNGSCRRWAFINALEAIDLNGEYYYDYENEKMYVYFEDEASLDEFYLASNREGVLDINGVNNVSFRNVDIRYTQKTLVNVNDSENISFIGCSISNAAVKGAIVAYSTNVTFKDCYLYDFGAGALAFDNCNIPNASELVSANLLVENCDIGFIAHRDLCYSWAVSVNRSTGLTVKNCTIHDGTHGAFFHYLSSILTYEYNNIYNFIREVDDAGLWYDHATSETQVGIAMRYNYIHDIGSTWQPWGYNIWYNDSYSTGYSIYGNLITDISRGGNAKTTIFGKMKLGEAWGNIVANVGDGVSLTTNNMGSGIFWAWRDMYDTKTVKDENVHIKLEKYGLVQGTWDESLAATDEGRNYSYKMMQYVLSDEFYYSVYGTAIAKMNGLHEYVDADYYVQINNENIDEFAVKVKKSGHKDCNKEVRFESIDEMFDYLYTEMGYTAALSVASLTSFEIHYYGGLESDDLKVVEMYPPLYTYNEADEVWELSKGSDLLGLTEQNFWNKDAGISELMGRWQFAAENSTNLGTYHDNLTLNMARDFTELDPTVWYHNGISKYNNYDADIEMEIIQDGEYTVDFLDTFDTIKAMGSVANLEILDLSKVGCTLKAK